MRELESISSLDVGCASVARFGRGEGGLGGGRLGALSFFLWVESVGVGLDLTDPGSLTGITSSR